MGIQNLSFGAFDGTQDFSGPDTVTSAAFGTNGNSAGSGEELGGEVLAMFYGNGTVSLGTNESLYFQSNIIPFLYASRIVDYGTDTGAFSVTYNYSNTPPPSPVPEPSGIVLAGVGVANLLGWGWRGRKRV